MPGTSTVWFETARARYSTALEGVQVVESREHELQMFLEPNAQYQEVLGVEMDLKIVWVVHSPCFRV